MNKIYLNIAKENEMSKICLDRLSSQAIKKRNFYIVLSFEDDGCSQKEIANALGLSESRVKKIIGEMKKNGENK